MEIIKKNLLKCGVCGKLKGTIEEKNNWTVPVICKCELRSDEKINPSCMCIWWEDTNSPRIIWRPWTDSIDSDGIKRHSPIWAGPSSW